MTSAIVKNESTGSHFSIKIKYQKHDDKYLLTLKDCTKKKFLCKKQQVPRMFAHYGVPV